MVPLKWMAPEVLASEKYAETADVYSFAIVCWELLTRACPYQGLTQIQVRDGPCQGMTLPEPRLDILFLSILFGCLVVSRARAMAGKNTPLYSTLPCNNLLQNLIKLLSAMFWSVPYSMLYSTKNMYGRYIIPRTCI